MTAERETIIWCDSCGDWFRETGNATHVRKLAKKQRWIYKNKKDRCPFCATIPDKTTTNDT